MLYFHSLQQEVLAAGSQLFTCCIAAKRTTSSGGVNPCESKCSAYLGSCSKKRVQKELTILVRCYLWELQIPQNCRQCLKQCSIWTQVMVLVEVRRCIQQIYFLSIYTGHRLKKLLGFSLWVVQLKWKILLLHWVLYPTNPTHTQHPKQSLFDP